MDKRSGKAERKKRQSRAEEAAEPSTPTEFSALRSLIPNPITPNPITLIQSNQIKTDTYMKKKPLIELLVKMIVAALTAFLTALTTTSCMGHGPLHLG